MGGRIWGKLIQIKVTAFGLQNELWCICQILNEMPLQLSQHTIRHVDQSYICLVTTHNTVDFPQGRYCQLEVC